jgi:hypothetical protein
VVVALAARLLHLLVRKALILFLVLSLPRAVVVVHQAEMEIYPVLRVVQVAAEAAVVAVVMKQVWLAQQVKVTQVVRALLLVKTIPVAVVAVQVL